MRICNKLSLKDAKIVDQNKLVKPVKMKVGLTFLGYKTKMASDKLTSMIIEP